MPVGTRLDRGPMTSIPLRAIKITIRYRDVSSNQMRDLTIIHSFADRDNK